MSCSHVAAAGSLVIVIGSTAVSAQALVPGPLKPAATVEIAELSKKPFLRLFRQAVEDAPRGPTPALAPRQICGMKVLPVDPNLDPKFEVPLRDTTTRFTIRIIPFLCR